MANSMQDQPAHPNQGDTEVAVIMTTNLTTAGPTESLVEVARLFRNVSFHHLPVVEDDRLLGIISDRDVSNWLAGPKQTSQTAADIMSKEPVTVHATTSVETASILLLEHQFSCLPVVNDHHYLVGILTWKDLLRFYVYHS
jgi:acetoin utilization protein AcuB